MENMSSKCADWALLLLRLVLGVVFIYHGYGKLFGPMPGIEGFTGMLTQMSVPLPMFFAYVVGLVEFLGGIAMILGLFTKYAGYLLAFVMAVAIVWYKKFAYPSIELELSLFSMALAVATLGPGVMTVLGAKGLSAKYGNCGCSECSCSHTKKK